VPVETAALRIIKLAEQMRAQELSGTRLKEDLEIPGWLKQK
jgi:hypothetical protein